MIICCGEALIDMLPRTLQDGSRVFMPVPGGALYNTAIALGRLGEETGFVSGISTDFFGQQLISHLEASHVSSDFCVRSANPTTLAFVTLTDGVADYAFMDENTAGRMLRTSQLPTLPASIFALHFGAISLIQEPCGSTYEALMETYKKQTVISLDPNVRPAFVSDMPAYRSRLLHMISMSDIIKVSDEDLAWLAPGIPFEEVTERWLSEGATIVLLTKGAGGVWARTKTLDLQVPAEPVNVVDTVGAGDTFNAGFLAYLRSSGYLSKDGLKALRQGQLIKALTYASQVAAYTVGQAGANPPWKKDLKT